DEILTESTLSFRPQELFDNPLRNLPSRSVWTPFSPAARSSADPRGEPFQEKETELASLSYDHNQECEITLETRRCRGCAHSRPSFRYGSTSPLRPGNPRSAARIPPSACVQ